MNIVYIDGEIDTYIELYLDKISGEKIQFDEEIHWDEIEFTNDKNFEDLLKDEKVKEAEILIIDDWLFRKKSERKRFTGRQFRLILKKVYPYKEVIVITQFNNNSDNPNKSSAICKFSGNEGRIAAIEYYEQNLSPEIKKAIDNYKESIYLINQLNESNKENNNQNSSWLIDEISELIFKNYDSYQDLKKTDIDNLIALFNELEMNIRGRLQNK